MLAVCMLRSRSIHNIVKWSDEAEAEGEGGG